MKRHALTAALVSAAALALQAAGAPSVPRDSAANAEFLAELDRTVVADGPEAALATLTNHLATATLSPGDTARCKAALARLLVVTKHPRRAAAILTDELPLARGVTGADILPALSTYINPPKDCGDSSPYRRQQACLALPRSPAFAPRDASRAKALSLLASVYERRSFCDLALAALMEAVDCCGKDDADLRVSLLFKAAKVAQEMRDTATAERCLRQIQAVEKVPYATARRALLLEGMNNILVDQFDWAPTPDRLEKARALIDKAIDARPSAISNADAYSARRSLMQAYRAAGDLDKAIAIGRDLVDNPPPKSKGELRIAQIANQLGDILTEARQFKLAIRYYERSLEGHVTPKQTHLKIATAARGAGDYARAIQAYTDALPFCDWVEGKDEIEAIKRKAAIMSRAIRRYAKATSAEELFSEESEEITSLQLDEL